MNTEQRYILRIHWVGIGLAVACVPLVLSIWRWELRTEYNATTQEYVVLRFDRWTGTTKVERRAAPIDFTPTGPAPVPATTPSRNSPVARVAN